MSISLPGEKMGAILVELFLSTDTVKGLPEVRNIARFPVDENVFDLLN